MKKVISSFAIAAVMTFGFANVSSADSTNVETTPAQTEVTDAAKEGGTDSKATADEEPQLDFVQTTRSIAKAIPMIIQINTGVIQSGSPSMNFCFIV